MGEMWNRAHPILTAWRADFIRTEPASHLLKPCGEPLREQEKETSEMGSIDSSRAAAHLVESDRKREACCSSPSSMRYWCVFSLIAWGLLSLLGVGWHPLHATSAATILFAVAIGCFANWIKNRTFHCSITAWIFLAGGLVFLLVSIRWFHIEPRFIWPFILVGTGLAFLLEWRYATRPSQ